MTIPSTADEIIEQNYVFGLNESKNGRHVAFLDSQLLFSPLSLHSSSPPLSTLLVIGTAMGDQKIAIARLTKRQKQQLAKEKETAAEAPGEERPSSCELLKTVIKPTGPATRSKRSAPSGNSPTKTKKSAPTMGANMSPDQPKGEANPRGTKGPSLGGKKKGEFKNHAGGFTKQTRTRMVR